MMVHAAPGGPFDAERALPAEVAAKIEAAYHLDEPLPQQFLRYMSGVVQGDLGPSYRYREYTVSELIGTGFPVSLKLGALAIGLAVILGLSAGTFAALRQGSMLDRVLMSFAMTGISIPVFVVGPVLVLLFAVKLNWFPAGWSGASGAAKYVLPVITLALPQVAYTAENVQSRLEEETRMYLHSDRGLQINYVENTMMLSKLFDWFAGDFESKSGSVINYIKPYLDEKAMAFLDRMPKKSYITYNWALNAKEPLK